MVKASINIISENLLKEKSADEIIGIFQVFKLESVSETTDVKTILSYFKITLDTADHFRASEYIEYDETDINGKITYARFIFVNSDGIMASLVANLHSKVDGTNKFTFTQKSRGLSFYVSPKYLDLIFMLKTDCGVHYHNEETCKDIFDVYYTMLDHIRNIVKASNKTKERIDALEEKNKKIEDLKEYESELMRREGDAERRENILAVQAKDPIDWQTEMSELKDMRIKLIERETVIANREDTIAKREDNVADREAIVEKREAELYLVIPNEVMETIDTTEVTNDEPDHMES